MNNPWENAVKQVEMVRNYMDIPESIYEKLIAHDRVIEQALTIKMDDGTKRTFRGFRAQHNNVLGPYKGGLRFHPQVSYEEVKALSMWMSWKCSVADLPMGGGKGGIVVDPKSLSENELERLSKEWVKKFAQFIGPRVDVPAPDVNTNGQIMGWMVEEMSKFKTQNSKLKNNEILATFTGKLVENGGSLGRNEATGRGGVIILAELAEKLNMKPNEITIAVQGIGNVGFWFAKLASEMGFKVVAVSDSRGGIVQELGARSSELGLTMEEVLEYKEKHGQVQGLDGTVSITNEELLELPVDVLVPAALENVINNLNADKIKAKVVIEMANGPVTPEADKVLLDRGIISVPDILANSGGVSVSYYEWVQNLENEKWTEAQVNEKLAMKMKKAFGQVWEKFLTLNDANGNKGARSWELGASKDNKRSIKVNMRTAAYVVAIGRVVEKMG